MRRGFLAYSLYCARERCADLLSLPLGPVTPGVKPNCKFSTADPARPAGISTNQFLRGTKSIAATNNVHGGQSTERPWLERTIVAPSLAARYDTTVTRSASRGVRTAEDGSARNGGTVLSPTRRRA